MNLVKYSTWRCSGRLSFFCCYLSNSGPAANSQKVNALSSDLIQVKEALDCVVEFVPFLDNSVDKGDDGDDDDNEGAGRQDHAADCGEKL